MPAVYLEHARGKLGEWIGVGCETAFSGNEISPAMIKDVGCQWVILGHQERSYICENAEFSLENGLKVLPCIGEKLKERKAGKTEEVCYAQLETIADKVTDWSRVVLAYEPFWNVGTGTTSITPEQVQEVHAALRKWLRDKVNAEVSENIRILYGGSVTGANCKDRSRLGETLNRYNKCITSRLAYHTKIHNLCCQSQRSTCSVPLLLFGDNSFI